MRKKKGPPPIAIDCFSGCGGMSEGLKLAGYEVVGAIEIQPYAVESYKLNHPDTYCWNEDIRNVSAESMLQRLGIKKGQLDFLGGCPPCQGFSRLRTMNGGRKVEDERNDLIYEFQRLVLDLYPKFVMLENVPWLIKDQRFSDFTLALERAGYHTKSAVLNVVDFGVPQNRKRTVMVASRLFEPSLSAGSSSRKTVREAIGHLPKAGLSGDPLHDLPERRSKIVEQRISSIPKNGGGRASLPKHLVLDCHRNSDGFKDVYGRMAWDEPSPTITTGCFNPSKGRFLHPEDDRAITIREAALLQSFPQAYKFPEKIGKVRLAEMIGNALPPDFIKVHAAELRGGKAHG